MGIKEDCQYESRKIKIDVSDKIFMFTDGIPESRNEKGEFFTELRLENFVKKAGHLKPDDFIKELNKEVNLFCGDRLLNDDRACLAIQFIKQ